ncbi:hypothetical protein [Mesorhizobium sp. KR1-2]|uniref:hypothetical protein n=1 Tax=Mesorhizobium sp. KR1-2 TaxID=3156609 RepID=UPI0032B3351F
MAELKLRPGSPFATQRSEMTLAIAKLIGWDQVDRLAEYYAGRGYIYIPEEYSDDLELTDAIGEEDARKIINFAPRDRFYVLSMSKKYVEQVQRIDDLHSAIRSRKYSTSELAKRFRYSDRWIRGTAQMLGVRLPHPGGNTRLRILGRLRAEGTSPETIAAIALEVDRPESWIAQLAKRVEEEAAPEAVEKRKAEKLAKERAHRISAGGRFAPVLDDGSFGARVHIDGRNYD